MRRGSMIYKEGAGGPVSTIRAAPADEPAPKPDLRPQHVEELRKRGISEEFALESGVASKADNEVRSLGFAASVSVEERKKGMQGILFTYSNLTRETEVSYRLKPDQRFISRGKPSKYL